MSWDSTPWFIGVTGAQHSPEVARLLAYAATNGGNGVIDPTDCKVAALATPAGKVRIAPGAVVVRNRAASGRAQTFIAHNRTEDVVDVPATTSAGGRRDLIAVMIEDPSVPGGAPSGETYPLPSDPVTAQYVRTRVVPNVPAGITRLQDVPGYANASGEAIAAVTLPASTGTVTNAMVTDLRRLALSRQSSEMLVVDATGARLESTTEVVWPPNTFDVAIPEWATDVAAIVSLNGAMQYGGPELTTHRVAFGTMRSSYTDIERDTSQGGTERVFASFLLQGKVPDAMRGTRQTMSLLGRRSAPSQVGRFQSILGTQLGFDVRFSERVS